MPVISSDSAQIAMVAEVTPGTTPATPAFLVWRTTGESLVFQPNAAENDELGSSGRSQKPADVVGQTVNGAINFRLAKFDALEAAMASVLANDWGICPLTGLAGGSMEPDRTTVGRDVQTFTIEKRFPDPQNPGGYLYQWYKGCTFSTLNITTSPNSPVTGSVTVVGGVPSLGAAAIVGATYTPAGNGAAFTAPEVLELTVGTDLAVGTNCWTSISITLDSQNRGIPCIGSTGDREVVLGTLAASVSGEVHFSDQAILEAILANDTMGDGVFIFSNTDGDAYRFDMFDMKPVAGTLSAGGAGEDLTIPLELQPTPEGVCEDTGEIWEASVILSRVATAPPAFVPA